jgi:glycosyltransferase involved in cell wall biosynthesis
VRQDGLDPEKVATLYNGIELEKIATSNGTDGLRSRLGLIGASPLVATVAHIRKVKGIDVFIRAAAIVVKEFPSAVFLVIGDASEREHFQELQELARSLGLSENVRFLGDSAEVFSLLKMSDAFCLLSRSEGFSNALVEAMACGLPCVVTRVGGNSEAVRDNESGFLVAPEDAKSAAERILELLRCPEIARRIGQAARQTVEKRFTARAMMSQLVELYDDLAGAKLA